ncbi:MAG: hypothetical protein ACM359_01215 [Bacillota bacterium]
MNRFAWVLIGVLASAAVVRGAQYEIPLPELKGVYSTGDIAPMSGPSIRFPAIFKHIDAVYLDVTGNVAPSLWREMGSAVENKTYPDFFFQFTLPISEGGQTVETGIAGLKLSENGPFHVVEPFTDFSGSWDFLLYGQSNFRFSFYDVSIPDPSQVIVPAIGAIIDARLIIEGTPVPEPTSALLILPGLFILARRHR